MLAFLLVTMGMNGFGGFMRTELAVTIDFPQAGLSADPTVLAQKECPAVARNPGPAGGGAVLRRASLGKDGADQVNPQAWRDVAEAIIADPSVLRDKTTRYLPATHDLATAYEGDGQAKLVPLAKRLYAEGKLKKKLDPAFLTRSDATDPQLVGIWGALKGSVLTMLVTLVFAFPVGVLAALYLEEYAPKNRWTDLIEVSINNLAAVPSIIFGLLGLAVFLAVFPSFRSAPLIGGLTLALMTMPVIVISGRNAIKAVPPSIRDGALGARRLAGAGGVPPCAAAGAAGILTGTIIGMARALGETAPALMIGMRAFVATPPDGFTSPSTLLPVQIFLWSRRDRPRIRRTDIGGDYCAIGIPAVMTVSPSTCATNSRKPGDERHSQHPR